MKLKNLQKFGECYNNGDFSPLDTTLHKDCVYQSFDFLYVLEGKPKVVEELERIVKNDCDSDGKRITHACLGYYSKPFLWIKTINDCIIIVSEGDNASTKIFVLSQKRGKLFGITGLDPNKTQHIRGKRI